MIDELVIVSFLKISSLAAVVYLPAYMNFCPYFPHLLSDFSEILYKRSEHDAFKYCEYRENRLREDLLSYGRREITFMRLQGNHMALQK
jgi:hypothetical protein